MIRKAVPSVLGGLGVLVMAVLVGAVIVLDAAGEAIIRVFEDDV